MRLDLGRQRFRCVAGRDIAADHLDIDPARLQWLEERIGVLHDLARKHRVAPEALSDHLAPGVLPAIVFILAGLTAFATGTSWGTMGILFPLTVPAAAQLGATPDFLAIIVAAVYTLIFQF